MEDKLNMSRREKRGKSKDEEKTGKEEDWRVREVEGVSRAKERLCLMQFACS